jgi:ABC-type phosphate transport system substrate-binding protein
MSLAYASETGLPTALLVNRAGTRVKANGRNIQSAAEIAPPSGTSPVPLLNPPGESSYPLQNYLYVVYQSDSDHDRQTQGYGSLRCFVLWSLDASQSIAGECGLVALPSAARDQAQTDVRKN